MDDARNLTPIPDEAESTIQLETHLYTLMVMASNARILMDGFAEASGRVPALQASYSLTRAMEAIETANQLYAAATRTGTNH